MNRGMKNVLMAGVGAIALGFAGTARAELITNGSFEGGLSPWTLQNLGVDYDYEFVTNFGFSGTNSVRFGHGATANSSLFQNVAISAGESYHFSMWVYNNGVGDDELIVRSFKNGSWQEDYAMGIVPTGLESWGEFTIDFTANFDADELWIQGRDQIATYYVDDVSLTVVPGPASATLLGVGGLAWLRRRR